MHQYQRGGNKCFHPQLKRLNDRRDAAGDAGADAGFTLIELMVVLLILAILLAIAIPTFLGVTVGQRPGRSVQPEHGAHHCQGAGDPEQPVLYAARRPLVDTLKTAEPSLNWISVARLLHRAMCRSGCTVDGNGVVLASYSKNTAPAGLWLTTSGTITRCSHWRRCSNAGTAQSTAAGTLPTASRRLPGSQCDATAAMPAVTPRGALARQRIDPVVTAGRLRSSMMSDH